MRIASLLIVSTALALASAARAEVECWEDRPVAVAPKPKPVARKPVAAPVVVKPRRQFGKYRVPPKPAPRMERVRVACPDPVVASLPPSPIEALARPPMSRIKPVEPLFRDPPAKPEPLPLPIPVLPLVPMVPWGPFTPPPDVFLPPEEVVRVPVPGSLALIVAGCLAAAGVRRVSG